MGPRRAARVRLLRADPVIQALPSPLLEGKPTVIFLCLPFAALMPHSYP